VQVGGETNAAAMAEQTGVATAAAFAGPGKSLTRTQSESANFSGGAVTMGLAIFGIAVGAGLLVCGAAYGIGKLAAAAVEGIARQPEAAGNIRGAAIVLAALIEGFTFFALLVVLLAGNKIVKDNWVENPSQITNNQSNK
jgi:F-type H+-transporting ATPase subunit c